MKKQMIITGIILLVLASSLALFYIQDHKVESNELKLDSKSDIAIMVYDDTLGDYVKQSNIPTGSYAMNLSKTYCQNGGTVLGYDSSVGSINYYLSTADKCYVYFDVDRTISDTVIALADGTEKTSSQTDGGVFRVIDQNGIRYQGKDPDNYVTFNGSESWRIIGVFEGSTIGLESGKYYTKLIKSASIGDYYWDETNSENNWVNADLNTYLTNTYLPSMNDESEEMIAYATYYLGGAPSSAYNEYTSAQFYTAERGSTGGGAASTTVSHQNYLGLMYPSDYGYAMYAGSASAACTTESTVIYVYRTSGSNCVAYDWLYSGSYEWTITPGSVDSYTAFFVNSLGCVSCDYVFIGEIGVRPVLYLEASVTVSGGSGTSGDPYILTY